MLISIIIGGFLAAGLIDLSLRKKFNIEKNQKFLDQYFNKSHLVIEVLACILFMTAVTGNGYTGKSLYILLFLFFAVIFVSRGAVEFIFLRSKRKHLISFSYMVICLFVSLFLLLLL